MEHNKELATAWEFVEHTGTSIFLTGKAGTGKTTFLKTVKERSSKRMIVVAPTGVAAINAGGVTIHSFFQLPLTPYVPGAAIRDRYDFSKEKRRIIRSVDMVVIDEISMVRADLLDAIDFVLRRYRDATQPFGGVQLLMIGDLQQLTPVVTPRDEEVLRGYYSTPYFFGSKALQQVNYVTIQLTRVYRQQDEAFITILNHIRDGHPTPEDLSLLNRRCKPLFIPRPGDGYIRLTTHNRMADSYNENELQKLPGRSIVFTAEVKGEFPSQNYPAEERLTLKAGAQVMFIKNDPSGRHLYYNGRIGHITSISNDGITVRCTGDNEDIKVEQQEWENTRYVINPSTKVIEPQVQGVFRQYPLRLAWAITIHKSQGLTFEHAIIDAGRSFASGQVYVALSRCKSLEGLVLASPIDTAGIINDGRVTDYISRQQQAAEESIGRLPDLKEEYYRTQLLDMFDFTGIYNAQQMLNRVLLEHFRSYPRLTLFHKLVLQNIKTKVIDVAYKWLTVIRHKPVADLHSEAFLLRVRRSADYFAAELKAQIPELLEKTTTLKCQNQRTAELLEERYKDLWMAYLQKENLLDLMAEEPFAVHVYMRNKQETMLDAMEKVNPAGGQRKRRRRKTAKGQA
ncbi:MAG: ATP-dependent RecD-like DNA helicase [Prevotella sp.]